MNNELLQRCLQAFCVICVICISGFITGLGPAVVAAAARPCNQEARLHIMHYIPSVQIQPESSGAAAGSVKSSGTSGSSSSGASRFGSFMKLPATLRRNRRGSQSDRVARLVRTRVEPKTFFANERTVLQWCGTLAETLTLCIHERWPSACIFPVCLGSHQTALSHPVGERR